MNSRVSATRVLMSLLGLFALAAGLVALSGCSMQSAGADWQPAEGPLMTRWAKKVSPGAAHREYPRPQMVRSKWLNLNGLWQYAIRPRAAERPSPFDGSILVPFPAESALSGVMKRVGEDNRLWYRRTFKLPDNWRDQRTLLHFEAVDWETVVWVNGHQVGVHRGGYDPFTFDITDALTDAKQQEIALAVWDPTDAGGQPRGKQVNKPHRIWYTPTTGIWQTVWLEAVNKAHIESVKIIPDLDGKRVLVTVDGSGAAYSCTVSAEVKVPGAWFKKIEATGRTEEQISIPIEQPRLWSPDSPFLYDLKLTLTDAEGRKVDTVKSYFGMRKVSLCEDQAGINRICLNDEPLFQFGPLDQGFWPDGLYAAPTDSALKYDIEMLKKLGCNMMRKHVKIEPRRFYYWCDKLGLLVWQDMPNGDNKSQADKKQFEKELQRMVDAHFNNPSIIMWVPFNEGWGQYDTERAVGWLKRYNPRRLVNNASGWEDKGVGDVHDVHSYPEPKAPKNEQNRAAVLGEFGGLGLPVEGHTWQEKENWGYRKYETREKLTETYLDLLEQMRPLIAEGLSAAVYTQTTDVEVEVNGLMTYDRAMVKMDADKVTEANKSLYEAMR